MEKNFVFQRPKGHKDRRGTGGRLAEGRNRGGQTTTNELNITSEKGGALGNVEKQVC